MWLLFHRNAKTRPVRDGDTFVENCPECGQRAKFVEVEIAESYGLFFIDLVGDKERAYKCCACGETFDLKDQTAMGKSADTRPTKSAAELQRERELAEKARRAAAEAKAIRIEDELAELKKRAGR